MTFSKFEKYAAGKINNHTSEVDAEGLWNDILPHVRKDNNRKRGLIWFFFLGLIVSLGAIYTLADGNNSNSGNEITGFSSAELIIDEKDSETNNSIKTESLTVETNETKNLISDLGLAQLSSDKRENKQLPEIQKNDTYQQEKYKVEGNTKSKINNTKTFEDELVSNSNNPSLIAEKEASEIIDGPENANSKNEESNSIENKEASPKDNEHSKTETEEVLAAIALVPDSTEESIVEEEISESKDEKGLLPPRRNKLGIKFGVGIYGGYSSSFSSLKAKDEMSSDYLQLRLGTEEQLETIQMGAEIIAKSKIGVYLKTGVQYSRIARKFSLSDDVVTTDSVHGIQRIYVNTNTNDTIYIYGPVPVETRTTYNKVTYNYFHLMDIPLLVGYTYNQDNWSFGAELGALINISTKTKGEILDTSGTDFYDMKEDPLNWFKDNVGVSFTASVMAAYHLNDNFQIYLAPTARLESVFSTDANPIDQKHGSLGINIGARYFIGY